MEGCDASAPLVATHDDASVWDAVGDNVSLAHLSSAAPMAMSSVRGYEGFSDSDGFASSEEVVGVARRSCVLSPRVSNVTGKGVLCRVSVIGVNLLNATVGIMAWNRGSCARKSSFRE